MDRLSTLDYEQQLLKSAPGLALLDHVQSVRAPMPKDLKRWRNAHGPELVSAALRIAECRRGAGSKFTRSDRMWLDRIGVEQATHELVARHKARRFHAAGADRVWDLCCGIGIDTIALAERTRVIAVDRSWDMCRRAAWNATIYNVRQHILIVQGRAEQLTPGPREWVHLDPDRRACGGSQARAARANHIADYNPGIETQIRLIQNSRGGAIKVGPASDFEAVFGARDVEIELVSLHGECKEAAVWFGELRTCSRRATCLPAGATWTDRDAPSRGYSGRAVADLGEYVFDVDPALTRAGLLDSFALAHQLNRIGEGLNWLTGTRDPRSPFLQAFRVESAHALDTSELARELARLGVGQVDIRMRGLHQTPDQIRARLRLSGRAGRTLFLHAGTASLKSRALITVPIPRGGALRNEGRAEHNPDGP